MSSDSDAYIKQPPATSGMHNPTMDLVVRAQGLQLIMTCGILRILYVLARKGVVEGLGIPRDCRIQVP